MKPIQIISQDLFDKIRSRFTNLELGDENGAVVTDPANARFFDFDFVLEGSNLGRVSISINDAGSLKVYYSQGITENQEDQAKKEWFAFLREMRMFSMRRLLRFDTRDIAKSNLDKNDFQHLAQVQGTKEPEDMTTMNESKWSQKSSKKTSRAVKGATEVIVRHARAVDEMFPGARSQRKNIKAIFIQNKDGERFKYPFIHPAGAFAMAQHVDHGGVPHDPVGKAIVKMSEDIAQLQEFQRTINRSTLHDDAMGISERAIGRLNELKATIEALGKQHHYKAWSETFQPDPMIDSMPEMDAVTMEQYKEKFTQTNFQEELEGYFPLLHRIMSETNTINLEDYVSEGESACDICGEDPCDCEIGVKEDAFSKFTEWAESVEQGTLTDDQIELLKQAIEGQEQVGQPLQLGPDGQTAWDFFSGAINPDNATGSIGAEFSDDLKNKLKVAANEFPDMDAMDVFAEWAKEGYPELLVTLGLGEQPAEQPAVQEPAVPPVEQPAAPAGDMPPPPQGAVPPTMENDEMSGKTNELMPKESMIKEIAKLVKSRYNRDNPEVGPFNGKENIALDVKKSIEEKFGEEAGSQAESLAKQFMEKLSNKWEEKHGKVEHDGLARLKELIGNIRGKIESVGMGEVAAPLPLPTNKVIPQKNPNPVGSDAMAGKQTLQPNPHPVGSDAMRPGQVIKDIDKRNSFFGQALEELDTIRKLSGLAK